MPKHKVDVFRYYHLTDGVVVQVSIFMNQLTTYVRCALKLVLITANY
jgi:hypothetical protein